MPFAWTAIYLMNIVNGAHSYERETSVDSIRSESEMTTRAASLGKNWLFNSETTVSFALITYIMI